MNHSFRVALVGDFDSAVTAHVAIPEALRLAGEHEGIQVWGEWVHTSSIVDAPAQFSEYDGIWCVPASPYANTAGALQAIRYARERDRPFLGTCGGFQHAVLEYARNVCGLRDAEHAELNPQATRRLIAPLACSLIERCEEIELQDGLLRRAYGQAQIVEGYHCSYGINREYEAQLFRGDLRATAHDAAGEVRGVELTSHPFFVATLFQPERRALSGTVPPIVAAFARSLRGG